MEARVAAGTGRTSADPVEQCRHGWGPSARLIGGGPGDACGAQMTDKYLQYAGARSARMVVRHRSPWRIAGMTSKRCGPACASCAAEDARARVCLRREGMTATTWSSRSDRFVPTVASRREAWSMGVERRRRVCSGRGSDSSPRPAIATDANPDPWGSAEGANPV